MVALSSSPLITTDCGPGRVQTVPPGAAVHRAEGGSDVRVRIERLVMDGGDRAAPLPAARARRAERGARCAEAARRLGAGDVDRAPRSRIAFVVRDVHVAGQRRDEGFRRDRRARLVALGLVGRARPGGRRRSGGARAVRTARIRPGRRRRAGRTRQQRAARAGLGQPRDRAASRIETTGPTLPSSEGAAAGAAGDPPRIATSIGSTGSRASPHA